MSSEIFFSENLSFLSEKNNHKKMHLKIDFNILIFILIFSQIWINGLSKNQAKKYCTITKVNDLSAFHSKEIFYRKNIGLKCDIKHSEFTLNN